MCIYCLHFFIYLNKEENITTLKIIKIKTNYLKYIRLKYSKEIYLNNEHKNLIKISLVKIKTILEFN